MKGLDELKAAFARLASEPIQYELVESHGVEDEAGPRGLATIVAGTDAGFSTIQLDLER